MIVPSAEGIYTDDLPANAPASESKKRSLNRFTPKQQRKSAASTSLPRFFLLKSNISTTIRIIIGPVWARIMAIFRRRQRSVFLRLASISSMWNMQASFQGTLYSKTLYNGIEPDTIDLYHLSTNDPSVTVTVKSGSKQTEYSSIFFRDYLDKKDKYCTYMGQNEPFVSVKTKAGNGKKLLIVKDSYAHSMIQFYMHHYSEICNDRPAVFYQSGSVYRYR